ncbi:MAG: malate dehydrogenase [candidate division KSB1 bacterium]|nr:malate dehydrogenase [candidate division KSB1 bacterium]MDZ7302607.1 malate dehydrogenase [candidate division KSB1 bacterium]MDZ7311552.1 malate dehydrogenase [candidate division KSB1 bacterium]
MKISVIGAGNVGATTALFLAQQRLGEILQIDIIEGMPEGKALDMDEAGPVARFEGHIVGTTNYDKLENSDIVVMTAGLPRKPGMTRMDLLTKNAEIVSSAMLKVAQFASKAIVVMVTNPLDVMTYVAWKTTGFPKSRVVGMAGVLDSTRFRFFVADALNVSVEDTQAMVLGGHGDSMVPLPRYTTVSGIPITQLLPADQVAKLVDRTRKGGTEIVNLLKTGSAYYAPAASVAQMVEAIVFDKRRLLPASAYLEGEYGLSGVFAGVPIILGRNGIEKIVEIELTEEEKQALHKSAAEVKEGIQDWEKIAK